VTGIAALLVLQGSGQVPADGAATGAVEIVGRHSLYFVLQVVEFAETVELFVEVQAVYEVVVDKVAVVVLEAEVVVATFGAQGCLVLGKMEEETDRWVVAAAFGEAVAAAVPAAMVDCS